MRTSIVILLCGMTVACTTVHHNLPTTKQNNLDPAFDPMIKSFVYEANQRGYAVNTENLSVTFGNIRKNKCDKTVGYCSRIDSMNKLIIKINTDTWDDMDAYEQEALIFHEIGHCVMRRDHCKKKNKTGPISIMYPYVLDGKHYKEFREELVDELFNISPECVGDDGPVDEVDGPVCPQEIGNETK